MYIYIQIYSYKHIYNNKTNIYIYNYIHEYKLIYVY